MCNNYFREDKMSFFINTILWIILTLGLNTNEVCCTTFSSFEDEIPVKQETLKRKHGYSYNRVNQSKEELSSKKNLIPYNEKDRDSSNHLRIDQIMGC